MVTRARAGAGRSGRVGQAGAIGLNQFVGGGAGGGTWSRGLKM